MVLAICTNAQARLDEVTSDMEDLAKDYLKGLMAKALKSHMSSYSAPDQYGIYQQYYNASGVLKNPDEPLPTWNRTILHIGKYAPYNTESGLDNLRKDLLDWSGANKINKKGFKIADGTNITLTDDEIADSALGTSITEFKAECDRFANRQGALGGGFGASPRGFSSGFISGAPNVIKFDLFGDNPYGIAGGTLNEKTSRVQRDYYWIFIAAAIRDFKYPHISTLGGPMAAGVIAKAKLKKAAELYDELAACVEIPSCSNANPNELVVFPFFPMLDSDGLPNNFDSTEDDGETKDQDLQAIEDSQGIMQARQLDIGFEQDFFGQVLPFIKQIENDYNNAANNFANSIVNYITGTLQQQSTVSAKQNELAKFDAFLCGQFNPHENSFSNSRGSYDGNGIIKNVLQLALFGAAGRLELAADISVAKETSSIKNMKAQLRVLAKRATAIVTESQKSVGFFTTDRFDLGYTNMLGDQTVNGGILVSNTSLAHIRRAVAKIIETGETNSERVKTGARRYALEAGASILSDPDFPGTIQSLTKEIKDTINNLAKELKQISIDLAALPSKIAEKKQEIVTRKLELANSELQRLYDESYKSCRAMAIVTLAFTSRLRVSLAGKVPEGENGTTVKHFFLDNPATDFEIYEGKSGVDKYKDFVLTTEQAKAFAERAAGIPLYDTGETYDLINQQQMLKFKKAGLVPGGIEGYLPNNCSVVLDFYHPGVFSTGPERDDAPEIELSSIIKQLYDANVFGGVFSRGSVEYVSGNKFKFTAFHKVNLTSCYSNSDFANPYL